MTVEHDLPIVRACQVAWLSRAAYCKPGNDRMVRDAEVITALQTIVVEEQRWAFWKCHDRLRAQGYGWNHKRVRRVYCQLRLNLPQDQAPRPTTPTATAARRAAHERPFGVPPTPHVESSRSRRLNRSGISGDFIAWSGLSRATPSPGRPSPACLDCPTTCARGSRCRRCRHR